MKRMKPYWSIKYYTHMLKAYESVVNGVDIQIDTQLSANERRTINTLICKNHLYTRLGIESMQNVFKDIPNIDKKRLQEHDEAVLIHSLYDKAGVNETDRVYHWDIKYHSHLLRNKSYNFNAKPARQDNKTFINRGSGGTNRNKIRYPSKKRKTAWKRFYKLFPHLKPQEEVA